MPKLAANISTLFLELPVEDRPLAAAKAGFKGIELFGSLIRVRWIISLRNWSHAGLKW